MEYTENLANIEVNEYMPVEEIKANVLSKYNIEVYEIENIKFKDTIKQRAVYKVTTNKGIKCLKKVYYDKQTLLFIYSVIEWLNAKGILCPKLLPCKSGIRYVEYSGDLFILTDWIDGRKCDYDTINDIIVAAENLAKIHACSKNFMPIEGSSIRENDNDYFKSLNKHFLQLLELSNNAFTINDKFSKIYLDHFDYNTEKARESTFLLSQIDFTKPLGDSVSTKAICHLDYVNKNLIFTPDEKLYIIDFDKTSIDMPVHDIFGFLRRILKRENTSWDFDIFKTAIDSYQKIRRLSYNEHIVIYAMLMFPQKFWKVSRDYYKNRHQCNKEAFISILKKINKQEEEHNIFCENVKNYIHEKFKE
jgi:CotS family spore coat protein